MAKTTHPPDGYMSRLPGGLKRALTRGHWLPIIGAGMSATAATADFRSPPAWKALGAELAEELEGATTASAHVSPPPAPVEVISTYSYTYGRAALIERLNDLLLVDVVEPGPAHTAFAQLPFDTVVTTNVDFLLEEAYRIRKRPYIPLLGESQLSIHRPRDATYILKFHGDLRHPDHLVMTEDDYDGFLRKNPLMATYLSWWLLTREPIFIGYSLDDSDLRELLGFLRERLGRMTRPAWVLLASDRWNEASKFERRGVRPVILNSDPDADRGEVFAMFFDNLRAEWDQGIVSQIQAHSDATSAELRRPSIAPQLALFVASSSILALYRDVLFPSISKSTGLLPLGIDEIRSDDRAMTPMAIDLALRKAAVVVYEDSRNTPVPLEYVRSLRNGSPIIVIAESRET